MYIFNVTLIFVFYNLNVNEKRRKNMRRKTKNIIFIIFILLLCASIVFTEYLNISHSNNMPPIIQNGNQPPEMSNGDSGVKPPEKPDSEMNNEQGNNSANMEEMPPEKPDGSNDMKTPPEMPNNKGNMEQIGEQQENNVDNNYVYLILLGIESLSLSIIVLYLIMSGFNKKSFKETFANTDKIVICILGVIILTSGLTLTENIVTNKFKDNTNVNNNLNQGVGSGQNTNISYSSVKEITKSTNETSGEYKSTEKDENAILVSGDIDVALSDISIDKSGDSDGGDNTSFYGTNSGIIAKDGVNLILKNITVNTNATGANGVFSYGGSATTNNINSDGTQVTISDSNITTKKDNSGGIMTTGGGSMIAKNLTINTAGVSSAAIRSDRGGGIVFVDGGTYKTTGGGSPTIYSTADITVKNASLIATASEGVVIEGKNKITLENVTLTDTNNKLNGQSTTYKNIFLYQSMSGDASTGVSEFSATNSTITTNKGDTFYITNTSSKITLKNNKFINNDSTGSFLRAKKDSWGNNSLNGGIVELLMENQEAKGNIVIDSISSLDMTMNINSYYEGTINGENTAKEIKLKLDEKSKIKLTGDSYITYLDNTDISNNNIDFNGYKLYVNGKSIN